jgi:hypothetical protein
MCEQVPLVVKIDPRLAYDGRARWAVKPIDGCIASLVKVLQGDGIDMLGSCCGHGEGPGEIRLADGRTLTLSNASTP